MIRIADALESLNPQSKWVIRENKYENIEWLSNEFEMPSKEEVEAEVARLQAEYDAKEYARQRAPEYPPIGDQLDALFKAGAFPADMAAKIQAVKDKYPKA